MNKKVFYMVPVVVVLLFAFYVHQSYENAKRYDKFTEQDIIDFEREYFDLSNQERIKAGFPALQWDEELHKIARAHSQDMLDNSFVDHINPQGYGPKERGQEVGYECTKIINGIRHTGIAENIAWRDFTNRVYDDTLEEELIKGLKDSTPHYQNLISKSHETMAIGIAINQDHLRLTQNFC